MLRMPSYVASFSLCVYLNDLRPEAKARSYLVWTSSIWRLSILIWWHALRNFLSSILNDASICSSVMGSMIIVGSVGWLVWTRIGIENNLKFCCAAPLFIWKFPLMHSLEHKWHLDRVWSHLNRVPGKPIQSIAPGGSTACVQIEVTVMNWN